MALPLSVTALPAASQGEGAQFLGRRWLQQQAGQWARLRQQLGLLSSSVAVLNNSLSASSQLQGNVQQAVEEAAFAGEQAAIEVGARVDQAAPRFERVLEASVRAGRQEAAAVEGMREAAARLALALGDFDRQLRSDAQAARAAGGDAPTLDMIDLRRRGDLSTPVAPALDLLRRLRFLHEAVSRGVGAIEDRLGELGDQQADPVRAAHLLLLLSVVQELVSVSADDSLSLSMLRAQCRERRIPCGPELAAFVAEVDPDQTGFASEEALLKSALFRQHASPCEGLVRAAAVVEAALSSFDDAVLAGEQADEAVTEAVQRLAQAASDLLERATATMRGTRRASTLQLEDTDADVDSAAQGPHLVACLAHLGSVCDSLDVAGLTARVDSALEQAKQAELLLAVHLGLVNTHTRADDYDQLLGGLQELARVQQAEVADKLAALFDARRILDPEPAEFWVAHFGSQQFQVLWERFLMAFESQFGPQVKNDQRLLRALVVDRAGVVNVYSLQRFCAGRALDERFFDAVASQNGRDTNYVHIRKRKEALQQREALHQRKQALRAVTASAGQRRPPMTQGGQPQQLASLDEAWPINDGGSPGNRPAGRRAMTAPGGEEPSHVAFIDGTSSSGGGGYGEPQSASPQQAEFSADALYGVNLQQVGSPQLAPLSDWRSGIETFSRQAPQLPARLDSPQNSPSGTVSTMSASF